MSRKKEKRLSLVNLIVRCLEFSKYRKATSETFIQFWEEGSGSLFMASAIEKYGLILRKEMVCEVMKYLGMPCSRNTVDSRINDGHFLGFYIADTPFIYTRTLIFSHRNRIEDFCSSDEFKEALKEEVFQNVIHSFQSSCHSFPHKHCEFSPFAAHCCIAKKFDLYTAGLLQSILKNIDSKYHRMQPHRKGNDTLFVDMHQLKNIMIDFELKY